MIVDLSSPVDVSVNDGIQKELCSLSDTSVDAVAEKILALGRGTLIAKMDIKKAYSRLHGSNIHVRISAPRVVQWCKSLKSFHVLTNNSWLIWILRANKMKALKSKMLGTELAMHTVGTFYV